MNIAGSAITFVGGKIRAIFLDSKGFIRPSSSQ
jgi:hypothetical protein